MFTFVQSAAARLAAKFATHTSRSGVTLVKSSKRSYDPKFDGDLVQYLRAIESQDRTLLGNVRSASQRIFGKAKKLLAKRTQTLSVSASDESFCSPGTLDDEETDSEMPVIPVCRRPHVQYTNAPGDVQDLHGAGAEGSSGPRVQFLDPSGDVFEYRLEIYKPDFSDIMEEDEEEDDVAEMGDGATQSVLPFAISPFFCLPTTESTLAPPTPSETESGPSTPQSMPVLVYESASYEDALFTEFKAIIDWKASQ